MKKNIVLLLLMTMLLSLLSACGQTAVTNKPGESSSQVEKSNSDNPTEAESSKNVSKGETASSASGSSGGIYVTKGGELTDFLNAVMNAEAVFEEPINNINDPAAAFAQLDRVIVNMAMISMPQYDILSVEDLPKEAGKLMLSGNDGVREKNGDIVKFSSKKEYTEDQMNDKKGDKYSEQGTLNTSTNTLLLESKRERSGSLIGRTVLEIVILKDGTCLMQYLDVSNSMAEDTEPSTTAVFKRYNQKEYSAVIADLEGKTDFTYDSIAGKGDIKTDAMAGKYKINGTFTVKDNTGAFTE